MAAQTRPPPPGSKASCEALLLATGAALATANSLPSADALELNTATSAALRSSLASCARRSADLVSAVAQRYAAPASPFEPDSEDDGDDDNTSPVCVEAVFDAVVEAVDNALDHANAALDQASGIQDAVVSTAHAQVQFEPKTLHGVSGSSAHKLTSRRRRGANPTFRSITRTLRLFQSLVTTRVHCRQ
jgi:PMC2NT (NUC016) domain